MSRQAGFWTAFALTAVVCLGISLGLLSLADRYDPASAQTQSVPMTVSGEPLTVLVMATDSAGGLSALLLLRLIPEQQTLLFTPLPAETEATAGGRTDTLAALYRYGGRTAVLRGVRQLSVPVDRYLQLDAKGVTLLTAEAGGIPYTLGESEADAASLPAGEQTLDGRRLRELFHALTAEKFQTLSEGVVRSFLHTMLRLAASDRAEDFFSLLTRCAVDTNLSAYDYTLYLPDAAALAEIEGAVQAVRAEGDWERGGRLFRLSQEGLSYLSRAYGG